MPGGVAVFMILFLTSSLLAQGWRRTFDGASGKNDQPTAVTADPSGNVIVTGYTRTSSALSGNADFYTAKYAVADGQLVWSMIYSGPAGAEDRAVAVVSDSNGDVYVTGHSTNASGNEDYYTVKYASADGQELWSIRYNGTGNSWDYPTALSLDSAGNLIVTGDSVGSGTGFDFYTVKYAAANGAVMWERRTNGTIGDDAPFALAVDSSGNIIVTGYTEGAGTYFDYFTVKYAAADGSVLWSQTFNSPLGGTNSYDNPYSVAVDADGNAFVTGRASNGDQSDSYTVKYGAADGAVLWSVRYTGATGTGGGQGEKVVVDSSGNAIVSGSYYDGTATRFHTAKYAAADGQKLWEVIDKTLNFGSSYVYDSLIDASDQVIISGVVEGPSGLTYYTTRLAGTNGRKLWAKSEGSINFQDPNSIALDSNGHIIMTATTWNGTNTDFFTARYAPPAVSTSAATAVSGGSATLHGSTNPGGAATDTQFEHGITTAYGGKTTLQSVGSGTLTVPSSSILSNLVIGKTYHFRAIATNSDGTSYGEDQSFLMHNGFSDEEAAQITALPTRYHIGDIVDIDLSFINTTNTQKIVLIGLPKGLVFNALTKHITGKITSLLGEDSVQIRVVVGSTVVRSAPFAMSVTPYQFTGSYAGLLENLNGTPAGLLKMVITSPGAYTATLTLVGQTLRSARGTFADAPGNNQRTLTIPFAGGTAGSPAATTVNVTLQALLVSDSITGDRDGGTNSLRGFRLSKPGRTPVITRNITVVLTNTLDGDGVAVPAGTGSLSGTVDAKGLVKVAGFAGDAQPITAAFDLSQTNQAIVWLQPYKNKASYLAGIMTLYNLDLPSRGASGTTPLTGGLKWVKAADATEKSYPLGFPVQTLTAAASLWIVPPTSAAMADSLGLAYAEIQAAYINPLGIGPLPSLFRLTEKFALLCIAPQVTLPWLKGAASNKTGTFSGTLTLPNGAGAVSGVLLQEDSFGTTVGAGLIRVPLPISVLPKGSFQTISIELNN